MICIKCYISRFSSFIRRQTAFFRGEEWKIQVSEKSVKVSVRQKIKDLPEMLRMSEERQKE